MCVLTPKMHWPWFPAAVAVFWLLTHVVLFACGTVYTSTCAPSPLLPCWAASLLLYTFYVTGCSVISFLAVRCALMPAHVPWAVASGYIFVATAAYWLGVLYSQADCDDCSLVACVLGAAAVVSGAVIVLLGLASVMRNAPKPLDTLAAAPAAMTAA